MWAMAVGHGLCQTGSRLAQPSLTRDLFQSPSRTPAMGLLGHDNRSGGMPPPQRVYDALTVHGTQCAARSV